MRKLSCYVAKYGPEAGAKLYHLLQSQAAHVGVSARLRKKLAGLNAPKPREDRPEPPLPLFPEPAAELT